MLPFPLSLVVPFMLLLLLLLVWCGGDDVGGAGVCFFSFFL